MKNRVKRLLTLALGCALAVTMLAGCSDGGVGDAKKAISAIGDVTIESQAAIDAASAKYDALSEENKQKVDNYGTLEEAKKRLSQVQYAAIKEELEKANSLLGGYFAQYFDTAAIKAAVSAAEAAVTSSQTDKYASVLSDLIAATSDLEKYIKEESAKSYSAANGPADAPFAVDQSLIPSDWSFQPVKKQSGLNPSWIKSTDRYDADPNAVIPYIQSSGRPYSYTISTVPTKKITVQVPDGTMYDAYVNTEVNFEQLQKEAVNRDKNRELVERPGYFLVTQKGALALALQDFNGEDYYIIYG